MLQAATGNRNPAMNCRQNFAVKELSLDHIKMAVFVDVREMGQPSQDFRGADSSRASTVVRLNTLDECKRRFGNIRELTLKTVEHRRLLGNLDKKRETTLLLPVGREGSSDSIELDEIERQVIQGGTGRALLQP